MYVHMHVTSTARASNAGPKLFSGRRSGVVWSACYMPKPRFLPLTIKSRTAASCLLISLLSLLVGAAVAEDRRKSDSSLQIHQLTNAFRLLQLQLKQTAETAEHVQSILADLAQPRRDEASGGELPGQATVSKEQEHKAPSTHVGIHQGTLPSLTSPCMQHQSLDT